PGGHRPTGFHPSGVLGPGHPSLSPRQFLTGGFPMNSQLRRTHILEYLAQADGPLSATALAHTLQVSRQIIVGDVALLRASGANITATPRGYVLDHPAPGRTYTVACRHSESEMEQELNLMVDHGCTVESVVVEHPVYGQLVGQLNLSSRYDVSQFIQKAQAHD